MYGDVTNIDTEYGDRRMTVIDYGEPRVAISSVRGGKAQIAYLTPLGARQLIDALEPFVTPRAAEPLPPIDVAEVLDALLLAPAPSLWRVEYSSYGGPWQQLHHRPGTFTCEADARCAMNYYTQGMNTHSFRVRPVQVDA